VIEPGREQRVREIHRRLAELAGRDCRVAVEQLGEVGRIDGRLGEAEGGEVLLVRPRRAVPSEGGDGGVPLPRRIAASPPLG
jgi:hypothetical protein